MLRSKADGKARSSAFCRDYEGVCVVVREGVCVYPSLMRFDGWQQDFKESEREAFEGDGKRGWERKRVKVTYLAPRKYILNLQRILGIII